MAEPCGPRTSSKPTSNFHEQAPGVPSASKADAVAAYAPDGRMLYANEAAARIFGVTCPRELRCMPRSELARRVDVYDEAGNHLDLVQILDDALCGATPGETTLRYRPRGSGEERWCSLRTRRILDDDGAFSMLISIVSDITKTSGRPLKNRTRAG